LGAANVHGTRSRIDDVRSGAVTTPEQRAQQIPCRFVQFVYFDHWRSSALRTISATEAKQNLGALLDSAQSEPITIRRQNRDIAVVLSAREYDRLRAINVDEFERFCDRIGQRAVAGGLTDEKLAEILAE
jgi:prevent-host-death family protein